MTICCCSCLQQIAKQRTLPRLQQLYYISASSSMEFVMQKLREAKCHFCKSTLNCCRKFHCINYPQFLVNCTWLFLGHGLALSFISLVSQPREAKYHTTVISFPHHEECVNFMQREWGNHNSQGCRGIWGKVFPDLLVHGQILNIPSFRKMCVHI